MYKICDLINTHKGCASLVLLMNVKMLILHQCIDAFAEDVLAAVARATGECIGVQSSRHTSIAAAGYDVNLFTTDLSSTRIRSAMMSSTTCTACQICLLHGAIQALHPLTDIVAGNRVIQTSCDLQIEGLRHGPGVLVIS